MRKNKLLFIILIVLAILVIYMVTCYANSVKVKGLAEFAKNQFLSNDFEPFMDTLCEQGFSDLSAKVSFYYNEETGYDNDNKTLYLTCRLDKLVSDEIDKYYTTEYNGSDGKKIAILMQKTKNAWEAEYLYITEQGEKIILNIQKPSHYITIFTSSERKYEYTFGFIDTVRVEIDGEWVYYADEYDVEARPTGTHMPYESMKESEIDTTCLGKPTTEEKCKDFYKLKASHRSTKYKWYEDDIQDLEHLQCIVTVRYWDYERKVAVPGYVSDVMIYD